MAELIERHGQELLKYMAVREKAQKEWGVALVGHECDNNGPYAPYDPGASVNASGTGSTPALAVCAAILKLEKGATK
ncbi:MAG: hypothetical protein U9Q82_03385 [Chloroflexota bacterium]|nr:hypothetical protein [Chloroflexota bacterium]